MKLLDKQIKIGKYNLDLINFLWFSLTLITVISEVAKGEHHYHNYSIYKFFFQHISSFTDPYFGGKFEEFDCHYGPIFSLVIAPFTFFANWLGCIIWCMFNAWILFYAVNKLKITAIAKKIIFSICLVELLTATHNVQINPMIAAWMLLAFILVEDGQEWAATLFIALGFLTKLYGIVGLTFFLFSNNKLKFIGWFIFWLIVLFCLPMLISSPKFIVDSYVNWIKNVLEKNAGNITNGGGGMQDISFGGIIRRVFKMPNFSDIYLIIPFIVLYFLPLFKKANYSNVTFKYLYTALGLITVVVLSSSSESPTYIIAVIGCALWYVHSPKSRLTNTLIILVVVFTSLSATDLFPAFIRRQYFIDYSLKALPCVMVWLVILWQLNSKKFIANNQKNI